MRSSPFCCSLPYLGDEDLQPLLLGADISGSIDHRSCWTAAVELQGEGGGE